jgi:voltage-gated potassium channel
VPGPPPPLTSPELCRLLRRLGAALAGLVALLAYGTAGYILVEHYSPLQALFMTVITISTVGFQEVRPLHPGGEVLTMTVIAFGVIDFLYTFGLLVELMSSGEWQRYWRMRRVERRLSDMADHVIVCGYGRTGRQVASELIQSKQPFVVVEWHQDGLANVEQDQVLHVIGDAADDSVLERAGIRQARALVSAVDSDEGNVYIVLTARSLNPGLYIVARSSHPDSLEKMRRAGADRVVSPYTLSGRRMAALAMQPAVVDTFDLLTGGTDTPMRVEELVVSAEGAPGLTARDLRQSGAVLLALRSSDGVLRVGPGDDERLAVDDILVAMGTTEQLARLAVAMRPAATHP